MRLLSLLALPAVLAAPALTAPSPAADGAVSGYVVSAISYSLDGQNVDAVSFRLSPPGAATVRARLAPDEPWTGCALAGDVASCPVRTPLADVRSLAVVAAK
jgi:hypothetical protein